MVIFDSYVSLPEGNVDKTMSLTTKTTGNGNHTPYRVLIRGMVQMDLFYRHYPIWMFFLHHHPSTIRNKQRSPSEMHQHPMNWESLSETLHVFISIGELPIDGEIRTCFMFQA